MSAGAGSKKAITKTASLVGNVGGGILGGPVVGTLVAAYQWYEWYDMARWAVNSVTGGNEEKEL